MLSHSQLGWTILIVTKSGGISFFYRRWPSWLFCLINQSGFINFRLINNVSHDNRRQVVSRDKLMFVTLQKCCLPPRRQPKLFDGKILTERITLDTNIPILHDQNSGAEYPCQWKIQSLPILSNKAASIFY